MTKVISYPKNKHVKLSKYKRRLLSKKVFNRDGWQCECGNRTMLTLMHRIHAGMGGGKGPGDTMENCYTGCMICHDAEERHFNGKKKS